MQRKPALINFLCISACCLLNTALCGSRFNIDLNNTVRRNTPALPLQPRAERPSGAERSAWFACQRRV